MANKESEQTDSSTTRGAAASIGSLASGIGSEAVAHLIVACEQFAAHVSSFAETPVDESRHQLVDDLGRIRNLLVVSDKTALAYVVGELLSSLNFQAETQSLNHGELSGVLQSAAASLNNQVHQLQQDIDANSALALLPLVNDCRAWRDDILVSDSLMLAAGIGTPSSMVVSNRDEAWQVQRLLWVDYATQHHTSLAQRLLHWWRHNTKPEAVAPLTRQLERFASFTASASYLQTMKPLFQCAAQVAVGISKKQIDEGPALKSLFAQLERNVYRCARVTTPADLAPDDLLRNFLYYLAQIELQSSVSLELTRRFRLDRVHQIAGGNKPENTPMIGSGYHLINAIRSGVTQETALLRAWLDATSAGAPPRLVRLKVRLDQLTPVLTLAGATECLQCLELIRTCTTRLGHEHHLTNELRSELLQLLPQLDALLDRQARKSIVKRQTATAAGISGEDVYIDMAVDVCLSEVRTELQAVGERLLMLIQSQQLDESCACQLTDRIELIDNVLQVLPLPELSPLLGSLQTFAQQLSAHSRCDLTSSATVLSTVQCENVTAALTGFLRLMHDYLSCVLHPQPDASQYLIDAHEALDNLSHALEHEGAAAGTALVDLVPVDNDDQYYPLASPVLDEEPALNNLPLSDIGSLTLNVEDDLLLDSYSEGQSSPSDSTLDLLFKNEVSEYLESLEYTVQKALSAQENTDVQLPDEQMLRALHSLTGSAQTMGASVIVAIAQPLQRVALVLHREGRLFDIEQTRFIGELVKVLKYRVHSLQNDEATDHGGIAVENKLDEFLKQALTGMRNAIAAPAATLSMGAHIVSLQEVFIDEATQILSQLRKHIHSVPFTAESINQALACVHTLKGSARMAGRSSMSACAHTMEKRVQSSLDIDEKREALRVGYHLLHSDLLQFKARQLTSDVVVSTDASVASDGLMKLTGLLSDTDESSFDIAVELGVRQAQLGQELAVLRAAGRELEAGMKKLRNLQAEWDLRQLPATEELTAVTTQLDTAGAEIRRVLFRAEKQHSAVARSGANLQQSFIRARLIRFDDIRQRLNETIQDIASGRGVSVTLEVTGGELMIDRQLFKQLTSILDHLASNAVVHGMETPDERTACAKPDSGTISLHATTQARELVLEFSDDGRGIDRTLVNSRLAEQGRPSVKSDDELNDVLLSSGFTSIKHADTIAGHGLGLSAVRTAVEQLQGQVHLNVNAPTGLQVTLRIPQRFVVARVVLVQSEERMYGIPMAHVQSVRLVKGGRQGEAGTPQDAVEDDSRLFDLSHLLHPDSVKTLLSPSSRTELKSKPGVMVEYHGQLLGLQVDRIVGYRELITQPLGAQMASLGQFSEGSLVNTGEQVLIVDVNSLLEYADMDCSPRAQHSIAADRPGIPVVDITLD